MEPGTSIELTARQWATIDATMDGSAQTARENGWIDPDDEDDDTPAPDALPTAIREAGRQQVPWVGPNNDWPPDDQMITISLHPGQWSYIVEELNQSQLVYERIGDSETQQLVNDASAAVSRATEAG